MDSIAQPSTSKGMRWTGRAISALLVLALLASAGFKLAPPEKMLEDAIKNGFTKEMMLSLGILELVCTLIYAVPQTAMLGAILLTGYLGGAICTHFLKGENFAIPAILGVLVWLGLFLRDARVRALVPWRKI